MIKLLMRNKTKKDNQDTIILRQQTERILELKAESIKLNNELATYKARDQEIIDCLSFVRVKAKELEKEIKAKYRLETARLTAYREKWYSYVTSFNDSRKLQEDIDRTNAYLLQCQQDLTSMINSDLNGVEPSPILQNYFEEDERISNSETIDFSDTTIIDKQKTTQYSALDIKLDSKQQQNSSQIKATTKSNLHQNDGALIQANSPLLNSALTVKTTKEITAEAKKTAKRDLTDEELTKMLQAIKANTY